MSSCVENCRMYGTPPYSAVVVHGGPGAPGEMAPVARVISSWLGVLEPLQTETSMEGQVLELKNVLEKSAHPPVVLIGYSWGAMLCLLVTARYPELVKKLILVSCGPLEAATAQQIMPTRLSRLMPRDRVLVGELFDNMADSSLSDESKSRSLEKMGELFKKSDSYHPLPVESEILKSNQGSVFKRVWDEASRFREEGGFIVSAQNIRCPVVVIHGEYDPHPFEGVQKPLSRLKGEVRTFLLAKCGHTPWVERYAKEDFFQLLRTELCGL